MYVCCVCSRWVYNICFCFWNLHLGLYVHNGFYTLVCVCVCFVLYYREVFVVVFEGVLSLMLGHFARLQLPDLTIYAEIMLNWDVLYIFISIYLRYAPCLRNTHLALFLSLSLALDNLAHLAAWSRSGALCSLPWFWFWCVYVVLVTWSIVFVFVFLVAAVCITKCSSGWCRPCTPSTQSAVRATRSSVCPSSRPDCGRACSWDSSLQCLRRSDLLAWSKTVGRGGRNRDREHRSASTRNQNVWRLEKMIDAIYSFVHKIVNT